MDEIGQVWVWLGSADVQQEEQVKTGLVLSAAMFRKALAFLGK